MWYVYILKTELKKWYYVGSSNDLNRRLLEHNSRKVSATKPYVPLTLVWTKEFRTESEARKYERKIKDKRKEKERIIREEID